MGCRDDYKGRLRDYHRDPFPHSLLSTRQMFHVPGSTGRSTA